MTNSLSRRDLLGRTCLLGTAAAVASHPLVRAAEGSTSAESGKKLKVIVAGGHPGDPEYGCGGTIARYSDLGHEVALLYLNRGEGNEKSPDGRPVRPEEARAACEILKARPLFAGQIDGKAILDPAHYAEFAELIASEKPDIVFTQWPIDHHPDHRAISLLVFDAWVRLRKSFALYYYEVSSGEDTIQFNPTYYVDITEVHDRKRAACFAHATQSPDRYYALQESIAKMRGLESGFRQAEAYIRLVQSPDLRLPGVSE